MRTAKAMLDQGDAMLALMIYQTTSIEATDVSPAKLMLGRPIRNPLPSLPHNMVPTEITLENIYRRDLKYKEQVAASYNCGARHLTPLKKDDQVRMKSSKEKTWSQPMTVTQKANKPRAYVVEQSGGQQHRRNRRQLQLVSSPTTNNEMVRGDKFDCIA